MPRPAAYPNTIATRSAAAMAIARRPVICTFLAWYAVPEFGQSGRESTVEKCSIKDIFYALQIARLMRTLNFTNSKDPPSPPDHRLNRDVFHRLRLDCEIYHSSCRFCGASVRKTELSTQNCMSG